MTSRFLTKEEVELGSEYFYILDDHHILHQIQKKEKSYMYELVKTFNFSKHNLDDINNQDWSKCQLTNKAVIYNEIVYRVHSNDGHGGKAYFWYDRISVKKVDEEDHSKFDTW